MSSPTGTNTIPLIMDTDMGADDWMATLYLLQDPSISLQAITVTGTGLAHLDPGTQHALDLLQLGGQPLVPVAKGSATPLLGHHAFPESWRKGTDDWLGLTVSHNPHPPSPLSAVELLAQTIRAAERKPTLLALGPLTNLAETFRAYPDLRSGIERIYIMGGAVHVPGNVEATDPKIKNTVAEWNIFNDPEAAAVVFASGVPITLVPLDATNQAPVTMEFYNRLGAMNRTPQAEFVYQVLQAQLPTIQAGQYSFWDPLAAAVTSHPELVRVEVDHLIVNTTLGPESGRTQPVVQGDEPVTVSIGVEVEVFESLFLATLNGARGNHAGTGSGQ